MIGLPGELFQGVAAAGEGLDFRVHLLDALPVLLHLTFLPVDFPAGADPVQDAAVGEKEQPQRRHRRDDDDERDEVVVVAARKEAAFVFLLGHISRGMCL